ncbi:MAG: methyltransferase domain-containing protein [Rhodospirillales bacterium]|nr:MAG: methyltransferase domain-containing protein [Rhodospirillales bacterium]
MWRIVVEPVPAAAVMAIGAALERFGDSVSWFGDNAGPWQVEAIAAEAPPAADLDVAIAVASAAAGIAVPVITVMPVVERDWLAAAWQDHAAFRVGRFHLHGSHDPTPVPPGMIGLCVDAATAFGSGRHPSTAGCLLALGRLRRRPPGPVLDMGCGSGILAIAMAKLWRVPVVAVDNDGEAVRVTRTNAVLNGVHPLVRVVRTDGYTAPAVRRSAPYAVIAANILARPLRAMARELATALAPGGLAILSGFLAGDAAAVEAAHRTRGLRRRMTIDDDAWRTLVLAKADPRSGAARRCG